MKSTTQNTAIISLLSIALATLLTVSAFAQGGNGNGGGNGGGNGQQSEQQNNRTGTGNGGENSNQQQKGSAIIDASQPVSSLERIALDKMGEEEFLARDVYLALYEKWNIKTFSNIANSEQRHADQILNLTNAYSIENFSDHEAGIFHDEELQTLYNDLVEKGSISEIEALTVGAIIEDLDIYDLETFLKDVTNTDIQKVFENLNKGSRNHMRSFISQLEKRGATYTPIYITQERFTEVINGEHEQGSTGSEGEAGHDCENEENQESNSSKKKAENNNEEQGFFAWLWSWF